MVVDFAGLDIRERPVLILKTAGDAPLGVLGNVKNVRLDIKYNETSTLEFELPSRVDGVDTPLYDDVIGMRIVDVSGVGLFTLVSPEEVDTGVQKTKSCKAYSLEYEFAYKKITIAEGTFRFWDSDASKRGDTVLGMVMELMPSWKVGRVPDSIANKYRTFEVSNENLYNFIKGTAQESYNCIFDFDTYTRTVNVRDIDTDAVEKPVFISTENLAREIVVTEETEDIVTRLDVSGADGVSIRDVNPTGTNQIINLDYFMNTSNFTQALVDKYYAWKKVCEDNRASYYSLSIQYSLSVEQKATEQAKLVDLQGELTSLDNVRGVIIQGMAQGISKQSDLDKANADIRAKEAEVADQESKIASIEANMQNAYARIVAVRDACSFEKYFTSDERKALDRYIKDGEVSESSFVASATVAYSDNGTGAQLNGQRIAITGGTIERIEDVFGGVIYDASSGNIVIGDLSAAMVSAVADVHDDGTVVLTAYLNKGHMGENEFQSACVSVSGTASGVSYSESPGSLSMTATGYMYFSLNATEFQKRSVAWDLYEYGEEVLTRLSQPTYTFSVDSANFLTLEDFVAFKNSLQIGEKIYIEIGGKVLSPICIGVVFQYEDLPTLELEFSDSYISSDSSFKLVDLLNKSISMGKSVDVGKFDYAAFTDSGASTALKEFMSSALDVAKNAILSSSDQAVSWDGAGLKLRKWANESHTSYDPEQIWMNNNSIVMTDDNWNTAQIAVGKFRDENAGDCWGIVAPMIVGTLIAGASLVIESAKKDGGTAVFRMDADGCRLHNTDFSISGTNASGDNVHIVLNPELGMALGAYPVYGTNDDGKKYINTDNAKFWVDMDGNLHFKGTLEAADGKFTGDVTALSLTIGEQPVDEYVDKRAHDIVDPIVESYDDLIRNLTDTLDGKSTVFYGTEQPENAEEGDIWYDTKLEKIRRFNGKTWDDITEDALKEALEKAGDAKSIADKKIRSFSQPEAPSGMTNDDVGDLWIDTDDNNRLYRWSGTEWHECRDGLIEAIRNGTDGIYFTSSNVAKCELNQRVGLKITGADGTYFQVANSAMGFFNAEGEAMFYYEDGNMILAGEIRAHSGYIGGDGGWRIGTDCIYNGNSTDLGVADGVFLGKKGISVSDAIIMEPDGSFVIRSDNEPEYDDDGKPIQDGNYVFKIEPSKNDSGATTYTLYLGDVIFDASFVLPARNGGLGGTDRDTVSNMTGLHFIHDESELDSLGTIRNGDVAIIYSEGEEGASIVGKYTTKPSAGHGFLGLGHYANRPHRQSDSHFGIKGYYWNIPGLADEEVYDGYARVGVGETPSGKAAMYAPVEVTLTNSDQPVTAFTLQFQYNKKPSGRKRDFYSGSARAISIGVYNSAGTKVASGSFTPPAGSGTANVRLSSSVGLKTGAYYVVFYSGSTHTVVFIKQDTVCIPETVTGAAAAIWLRTGGMWRKVGVVV